MFGHFSLFIQKEVENVSFCKSLPTLVVLASPGISFADLCNVSGQLIIDQVVHFMATLKTQRLLKYRDFMFTAIMANSVDSVEVEPV